MIEDPVALTIRRTIERPAADRLAAFADAPTSFVVDAMNGRGALDWTIKPINPAMHFVGVAVTAYGGPRDNLAAMAALDVAEPGDVLVIATERDESGAVIGDLFAMAARRKGVVAIVTDGLARDAVGLEKAGMPTFARGLCPNSGFRNGPGTVNSAVALGGQIIEPGDVLVGDRDGVVVIPRTELDTAIERLAAVRIIEEETEAAVASGAKTRFWDPAAFKARGVHYLD